MTVPEESVAFNVLNPLKSKEPPLVTVTHSLKFQFHMNGAAAPVTCEVPVAVGSEWRPPLHSPETSFGSTVGCGGLGAARWCVLD